MSLHKKVIKHNKYTVTLSQKNKIKCSPGGTKSKKDKDKSTSLKPLTFKNSQKKIQVTKYKSTSNKYSNMTTQNHVGNTIGNGGVPIKKEGKGDTDVTKDNFPPTPGCDGENSEDFVLSLFV